MNIKCSEEFRKCSLNIVFKPEQLWARHKKIIVDIVHGLCKPDDVGVNEKSLNKPSINVLAVLTDKPCTVKLWLDYTYCV